MKTFFLFLLFYLVSFGLAAQNNIDFDDLPDVAEITVVQSNPSADTIVIGMHGGPTDMLYPGDFDFFEGISTFGVIEMQQYQHYNSSILANPNMTLEEAIVYNDTTVAMLQKTVHHYKDQGKTVVLIGHSFGAFILAEYMDDYGLEDVHRVVPMAGRLNMPPIIWENFAAGYWASFAPNGTTTIVEEEQADMGDWATMKIMAGMGYNRWVDSLATVDLTKLMYVYGEHDEAVGGLDETEVNLLEAQNAHVLGITNGSHDAPFFTSNITQVLDFIRTDLSVGIEDKGLAIAEVKLFPTIVEDFVNIEAAKEGQLQLVNLHGQAVQQIDCKAGKHQVALKDLPRGTYIAIYQTIDNEWASQKLLVGSNW